MINDNSNQFRPHSVSSVTFSTIFISKGCMWCVGGWTCVCDPESVYREMMTIELTEEKTVSEAFSRFFPWG